MTNKQLIASGLTDAGARVYQLFDSPVDFVVGYKGWTVLIIVKIAKSHSGNVSLKAEQQDFIKHWDGGRVLTVRTLAEAKLGLGIA